MARIVIKETLGSRVRRLTGKNKKSKAPLSEKQEESSIRVISGGRDVKVNGVSIETIKTVTDTPVMTTKSASSIPPHQQNIAPVTVTVAPPFKALPERFVDYKPENQSVDPYAGSNSRSVTVPQSFERSVVAAQKRSEAVDPGLKRIETFSEYIAGGNNFGSRVIMGLTGGSIYLGRALAKGTESAYLYGRSLAVPGISQERKTFLSSAVKPAIKVYGQPETYVFAGFGAVGTGYGSLKARAAGAPSSFSGMQSVVETRVAGGINTRGTVSGNIVQANKVLPITRTYDYFNSGETGVVSGKVITTQGGKSYVQKLGGALQEGRGSLTLRGGGLSKSTDTFMTTNEGGFVGVVEQPVFNARLMGLNIRGVRSGQSYRGVVQDGRVISATGRAKTGYVDVTGKFEPRGMSVIEVKGGSIAIGRGGAGTGGTGGTGGSGSLVLEYESSIIAPTSSQFAGTAGLLRTPSGSQSMRLFSLATQPRGIEVSTTRFTEQTISGNWVRTDVLERTPTKVTEISREKIYADILTPSKSGGSSGSRSDVVPGVDVGVVPVVDVGTGTAGGGRPRVASVVTPYVGTSFVPRYGSYRFPPFFGGLTMPNAGGFGGRSFDVGLFTGRKKEYTPSLFAVVGGIKGDIDIGGSFTGFEVRPVVNGRSRRRKKSRRR